MSAPEDDIQRAIELSRQEYLAARKKSNQDEIAEQKAIALSMEENFAAKKQSNQDEIEIQRVLAVSKAALEQENEKALNKALQLSIQGKVKNKVILKDIVQLSTEEALRKEKSEEEESTLIRKRHKVPSTNNTTQAVLVSEEDDELKQALALSLTPPVSITPLFNKQQEKANAVTVEKPKVVKTIPALAAEMLVRLKTEVDYKPSCGDDICRAMLERVIKSIGGKPEKVNGIDLWTVLEKTGKAAVDFSVYKNYVRSFQTAIQQLAEKDKKALSSQPKT